MKEVEGYIPKKRIINEIEKLKDINVDGEVFTTAVNFAIIELEDILKMKQIDVTNKYKDMLERFANDLELEKECITTNLKFRKGIEPFEFNISKLMRDEKQNKGILKDIDLLCEFAYCIRNNKLKIIKEM